VPATPVATGRPRRKRSTVRKHPAAHNRARAQRGEPSLRILLFRKGVGGGSRRVTALAAHAGRGS
jgi:hypothetical protein